jgi:hypothetical protein
MAPSALFNGYRWRSPNVPFPGSSGGLRGTKTILSVRAKKIFSRLRVNAKSGFKNPLLRIQLLPVIGDLAGCWGLSQHYLP